MTQWYLHILKSIVRKKMPMLHQKQQEKLNKVVRSLLLHSLLKEKALDIGSPLPKGKVVFSLDDVILD